MPTAAPPGHVRIQRGAHDPCPRYLQLAYLPPRHPRPGVRLRDQVVGQVPVTDVEQHDPQAVIAGGLIELREFHWSLLHTPYTHHRADPFSRLGSGQNQTRQVTAAAKVDLASADANNGNTSTRIPAAGNVTRRRGKRPGNNASPGTIQLGWTSRRAVPACMVCGDKQIRCSGPRQRWNFWPGGELSEQS
jgi:hypothetical protein